MLPDVRLDHLFPLYGEGAANVLLALKAGISLAWPVALLLTSPSAKTGRLRSALLPAFFAAAALLVLILTIPQELLASTKGPAQLMLQPTKYAPNALRVLYLCLLMIGIFLSVAAAVRLTTENICAPLKGSPGWLPHAILIGLILTQAGDTATLWRWLEMLRPWLLLPLAVLAMICLPMAILRRERV